MSSEIFIPVQKFTEFFIGIRVSFKFRQWLDVWGHLVRIFRICQNMLGLNIRLIIIKEPFDWKCFKWLMRKQNFLYIEIFVNYKMTYKWLLSDWNCKAMEMFLKNLLEKSWLIFSKINCSSIFKFPNNISYVTQSEKSNMKVILTFMSF